MYSSEQAELLTERIPLPSIELSVSKALDENHLLRSIEMNNMNN